MDDQSRPRQVYEFGGYRLDPLRRVLLGRDGSLVRLKPKAFDTLLYLVEHAGEALDKGTLLAGVWPNVVVEENNLNKNVSELRRVFGETPGEHRFIVTEPGRGYRFVADVRATAVDVEMIANVVVSKAGLAGPSARARWNTFECVLAGLLTAAVVSLTLNPPRRAPTCSRCESCPRRMAKCTCKCGDAV
jgi:DNA-binding winged helix-turn-helix (wHTH) protein